MSKNLKPTLLTLGLAAFLTGSATAQTYVRGHSDVEQRRIHNAEHGINNSYIYNRNAPAYRYNVNNGYYNNGYAYPTNHRYYRPSNNWNDYTPNNGYYNNGYYNNGYYNNGYYNNGYYYPRNNRGLNIGPFRINY